MTLGLGRSATLQLTNNGWTGSPQSVGLGDLPVVQNGGLLPVWVSTFGVEVHPEETLVDSFTLFVKGKEQSIKVALCSAFGQEIGLEATRDALAYGWEHWERIRDMDSPAGYLWKVGRNRANRLSARRTPLFESVSLERLPWVEPGLPAALERLSEKQRVAVLLVHGFEWTLDEVADLLSVSRSTVQKHTERAMVRLRRRLGVES